MDNQNYYEQFNWSELELKTVRVKIDKIIEFIPKEVGTIIDVGCGNGLITNALSNNFDITGVDRSKNALSFVKTKTINASANNIPVTDYSFDMVFSSELIEHIEDEIFIKTINEFKRIAKKYILITVPNRENIKKNLIQCPKCKFIYNRSYHLRSFSLAELENYFPEYVLLKNIEIGNKIRHYNKFLTKIKLNLSPPISWIPYYAMPKRKRKTFCPNCEHKFDYLYKFHLLAFACDMLNIIISPKRPYWQMVLLKKK